MKMFEQGKELRKTTNNNEGLFYFTQGKSGRLVFSLFSPLGVHSDLLPTLDWDFITFSRLVATTIIYMILKNNYVYYKNNNDFRVGFSMMNS